MKYTVTKSYINLIGKIWMPAITCGTQLSVSNHDLKSLADDDGNINRESIEQWLTSHTGDFQSVTDFYADIETDTENVIVPWASEESEDTFNDCMYPSEE